MPAPSYAYGVLVSVRDDNDPQPQSSDDALCRCTLALQNFVDATTINAVLLRPRCLASGFLDFAPKQLNNVLLLQDAHRCTRRLKLTVYAHAVGTTVIHERRNRPRTQGNPLASSDWSQRESFCSHRFLYRADGILVIVRSSGLMAAPISPTARA